MDRAYGNKRSEQQVPDAGAETSRRVYVAPALTTLGNIHTLTAGSQPLSDDGGLTGSAT